MPQHKGTIPHNKLTHEEFMLKFKQTGNPKNIKITGQYTGMNKEIEYETDKGEKRKTLARHILGWKIKKKQYNLLTHEEFMRRFKTTGNPKHIKIIGEYKGYYKEIEYEDENGNLEKAKPRDILKWKIKDENTHEILYGKNEQRTNFISYAQKYPECVKYFEDKELPYKISYGQEIKAKVICDQCHNSFDKWVYNIPKYGLNCPFCSDGQSYPNKFIRNVLELKKDILEEYDFEYYPKWENTKYRYDAYFIYNKEEFLIEMQGLGHYCDSWKEGNCEKVQKTDKEKKKLALKNGIKEENYIVIDARYSKIEFIRGNFEKSKLQSIFNLTDEDYLIIEKNCGKSLIKQICDYYNMHPNSFLGEIGEVFHMDKHTISLYLLKGNKFGLCDYNKTNTYRTKVKIKNIETQEEKIFESVLECLDYFNNNLKIKISQTQLRRYIDKKKNLDKYEFELLSRRTCRYNGENN